MAYDPNYKPTGPNNRSNEYYKKINHVRIARNMASRSEFYGSPITVAPGGVAPSAFAYTEGMRLDAHPDFAALTNPANWQTETGGAVIDFAAFLVNGSPGNAATIVQTGETVTLLVTDTAVPVSQYEYTIDASVNAFILTQPQPVDIMEGDTANFSVFAPTAAAYLWEYSTDGTVWQQGFNSNLQSSYPDWTGTASDGSAGNTWQITDAHVDMDTMLVRCYLDGGAFITDEVSLSVTEDLQAVFAITFETTAPNEPFTLPLANGTTNATMNVDGGPDIFITAWNDADLTQIIPSVGVHTLRLRGQARGINFLADATSAAKLRTVENLGELGWSYMRNAFVECSGMTSFVAGNTNTSAVTDMTAMFRNCGGMVSCDITTMQVTSACLSTQRMFTNCSSLVTAIDTSVWDTSNMVAMDETFNNCTSMDFSNLDISGFDLTDLNGFSDPLFNSMFNFLPDSGVIPTAFYNAFLIAQDAATLKPLQFFGLGDSTPTGAAALTARTSLINKGHQIEDSLNAAPDAASAPSLSGLAQSQITVNLPADPFNNGLAISNRAIDYRDVTGAGSWTEFGDGYTAGQSVAVTGLSSGNEYEFRASYTNFNGTTDGAAVSGTTTSSGISGEEIGNQPVITMDDSNPSALTFTVTGGNHPGTYTTNSDGANVTAADLAAGPVNLVKPTISGTTTAGFVLTAVPGLWVYAGADPGDPALAWQNDTGGDLGVSALTYRSQITDVGDTLSVDETFAGVTVSSTNTAAIAAGDTTAPTLAFSVPTSGTTDIGAIGDPPQVPIFILAGQSNAVFMNNDDKLGDALTAIGRSNAVIAYRAEGGQSVSLPGGSWNVTIGDGNDTEGYNYTALVAAVEAARVANPNSYIAGMLWMQGESDATVARDYYGPCRDMFEKLRTDLAEDFHITVLGLSSTLQTGINEAGTANVVNGMQEMVEKMPGVSLILADTVAEENGYTIDTAMRDTLHFSDAFLHSFAEDVFEQPVIFSALGLTSSGYLAFEETVVPGSGNFLIYQNTGGFVEHLLSVEDPIACSFSGSTIVLDPPAPLVANKEYSVRWDAGAIKDLAGNPVLVNNSPTLLTFGTFADVFSPALVPASCTPADGATNVAINSNITLVFNETVFAGTGNFYIHEGGVRTETIPVGSATIGTTDVVLNPVSNFTNDVDVSVQWDASVVEDAVGNGVAANTTNTLLNFQSAAAAGGPLAQIGSTTNLFSAVQPGNSNAIVTGAHTVAAGNNRLFVLTVHYYGGSDAPSAQSVTFGGQAMTLLGGAFGAFAGNVYTYYLKEADIPAGSQTATLSFTGATIFGCRVNVTTFENADQTTPFGTPSTSQSGGTPPMSIAITTSAASSLVYSALAIRRIVGTANLPITASTMNLESSGEAFNGTTNTGVTTAIGLDTPGSAGSHTQTFSWTGNGADTMLAVEVLEA